MKERNGSCQSINRTNRDYVDRTNRDMKKTARALVVYMYGKRSRQKETMQLLNQAKA